MAFTTKRTSRVSFESPEALFHDIRHRSVEGLLSHQADLLRRYQKEAIDRPDVAIELPTGSGKTLVGLLIAEFRRVTKGERVLYLCPTRQLVRQVVEQSEEKYGIKATAFVGKIREFDPSDKAKYQTAQTVAIATYSALFNTNPFFSSPQVIVLDDAHAAENYITAAWSVTIEREKHSSVYAGLLQLFQPFLAPIIFQRFAMADPDRIDLGWIEKLPTPHVAKLLGDLTGFLDANTSDTNLQYPWLWLKDHLDACHVFVSHSSILIRPYLPPSLTHTPFAGANQRIYMSATLGRGGDLERITGVKGFFRLPIPDGWDRQGIGRRFFMFPELSLKEEDVNALVVRLMALAKRSLVLVPSDGVAEHYQQLVKNELGYRVFVADDIEVSKSPFTHEEQAVAVLANRYDGIDLIGDECRLLFIRGLPKASNIQERFMMSRLGAGSLLDDRIRTRIIQAVGRCTRSATDYAAVCVLGDDFYDWLVLDEKRSLFHPELQAELRFGSEQAIEKGFDDFVENLTIFLEHGDAWNAVDGDILEMRDGMQQRQIRGQTELLAAAAQEVDYVYAMWNHDYERASELAQSIAATLSGAETKGFRGWWYYLAGASTLQAASAIGKEHLLETAARLFAKAAACLLSIQWLRTLAAEGGKFDGPDQLTADEFLQTNVEHIELLFDTQGYASPRKFKQDMKQIIDGLASTNSDVFEEAHLLLGEVLGFESDNSTSDATPDPWWVSTNKLCLVFEDKSDSKPENPIPVKHTRQAASHATWIAKHLELREGAGVICVMITPATVVHPEAATYAGDVKYWNIDNFRRWASTAIGVIRQLRSEYPGPGNLAWRASASGMLRKAGLDPQAIVAHVSKIAIKDLPHLGGKSEEA